MGRSTDVAIVGGGVIGSAIAYALAAEPAFCGSVLVIERDPSYAFAATGRSWGGIRQQFSTPENVAMSLYGAQFVKRAAEALAVDGVGPDLGFREQGYLFLAGAAGMPVLEANCALARSLGGAVAVLGAAELARRFPWLNTDGLAGAGLGLENEGWIDPQALLDGFRRKARALGATYATDAVVGVRRAKGRVAGLRLGSGAEVACGVMVNAAGADAAVLARMAGCELPVRPRKRMTYVFDCRQDLSAAPLTIDVTGVAFRPEGSGYIAIVSPPADRDPDGDVTDVAPEYAAFDEVIWPALAARVPAFAAIKLRRAWAGHYDTNTFDQNAILGPHPEIGGLVFANGFSGHGVQQSPAVGRAIAELIAFGEYRCLDLGRMCYERIARGQPLQEANVV